MPVERDTPVHLKPAERRAFEHQLIEATSKLFVVSPDVLNGSLLPQEVQAVARVLGEVDYHPTASLGAFLLIVIAEERCSQRVDQLERYHTKPNNAARAQRQASLEQIRSQRVLMGKSIFGESAANATDRARELFAPSLVDQSEDADKINLRRTHFVQQISNRFPSSAQPYRTAQ